MVTRNDLLRSWLVLALLGSWPQTTHALDLGSGLQQRLQGVGAPLRMEVAAEPLYQTPALVAFYEGHAYQPVWTIGSYLRPGAVELLDVIAAAAEEGLEPRHYHAAALDVLRRRYLLTPVGELANDLELLLSDAFFQLACDFHHGRSAPAHAHGREPSPEAPRELAQLLDRALVGGQVRTTLQSLLPTHPDYAALRAAWQRYQKIAENGGWPRIPDQPVLRRGSTGRSVSLLRQRLASEGELPAVALNGECFDAQLEAAVRTFQRRYGLAVNGVVGAKTRAALNVPASARARQLALNLERRRWLSRNFSERALLVNIPGFTLQLWDKKRVTLAMRVIVGRQARQTPNFSSTITAVVLNPQWDVPHSIAVADLLPLAQADASYLIRRGFHVYAAGHRNGDELDPASIDWSSLGRENFPYHLVQEPGPHNALGRLKFIVPNDERIYLHDTPSRSLFSATTPAFSSGCIRVAKPRELALRLLAGTSYASVAALTAALDEGGGRIVHLPEPRPIHIVYWTAWIEDNGEVQFRPDLYQRDSGLSAVL
ncbi:MAG: hypothetical protein A2091_08875 [Desulfuromonadales bacterium GWD2_61_12]|nr:MAG: hypothetical protein A2005_00515 [Desulfuromonadales bacterium GWC2_61_20]OGR32799.1 MAG: hypothetical protein A2091_08875 [Desulfuromonadales bacterium GWD2_61_12]HAD04769.1 hypothetical protein [Desulfuromonas sp.]HBT84113.1 hypothetical protein [Desulfuromonas sp.]